MSPIVDLIWRLFLLAEICQLLEHVLYLYKQSRSKDILIVLLDI